MASTVSKITHHIHTLRLVNLFRFYMFGLFNLGKANCPIDEKSRVWMEQAIQWLVKEFNEISIKDRKVFVPTPDDFPIEFDGTEDAGNRAIEIVAKAMHIDLSKVVVNYFINGIKEFNIGSNTIFTEQDKNSQNAAGLYFNKSDNGIFQIGIDKELLAKPERLVATLVHEFSHLKIIGEKRLGFNDEYLTDLTSVVFGFGIFNANCAFEFSQSMDRWGYSKLGYLSQMEWGYALALLAYLRNETNPEWLKYLNRTIHGDFKRSMKFIKQNEDLIFQEGKI